MLKNLASHKYDVYNNDGVYVLVLQKDSGVQFISLENRSGRFKTGARRNYKRVSDLAKATHYKGLGGAIWAMSQLFSQHRKGWLLKTFFKGYFGG